MQLIKSILKIAVVLSAGLLIGCHKQHSHQYLMQHPDVLGQEYARCHSGVEKDEAYCDMIKRAQDDFISLVDIQQANQEKFGQQIIESEQQLVVLQQALKKAQQDYSHDSTQFKEARLQYETQLEKVRVLLAVIKATGGMD